MRPAVVCVNCGREIEGLSEPGALGGDWVHSGSGRESCGPAGGQAPLVVGGVPQVAAPELVREAS